VGCAAAAAAASKGLVNGMARVHALRLLTAALLTKHVPLLPLPSGYGFTRILYQTTSSSCRTGNDLRWSLGVSKRSISAVIPARGFTTTGTNEELEECIHEEEDAIKQSQVGVDQVGGDHRSIAKQVKILSCLLAEIASLRIYLFVRKPKEKIIRVAVFFGLKAAYVGLAGYPDSPAAEEGR
jgi:hypothetical protein